MGYKGRDVEVIELNAIQCIVAACDSCGAIGSKELDVVKATPYIVGRFSARVSLMEVIAVGASPKMISVTISNELYPTGEGIIDGVKGELSSVNLSSLPMVISTEKNIPTEQTAVGITVIGACEKYNLRAASSKPGDIVYCLGLPKVGNEVIDNNGSDIVQLRHIQDLMNVEGVHDIIPIGSRGILGEVETMSYNVSCKFFLDLEQNIDIHKSAGPSTCLIFTCSPYSKLRKFNHVPLIRIGELK